MAKPDQSGRFTLQVPLNASQVKGLEGGHAVKVVAFDGKGGASEDTVALNAEGGGEASFAFAEHPGSVRVVVGPADASADELKGLQTISVGVSPRSWQGKNQLVLSPIAITPYYWWWWRQWCRDFTIRGRVLCPDGSPVPGAKVCAYDIDWWWWWVSEDQVGCATTDATGSFEINFRWCCGWWPWRWWLRRFWRVEPLLVERILPVLQRDPRLRRMPIPGPKPDLSVFEPLLESATARGATRTTSFDPSALDPLRTQLLQRLPASAELAQLRIWPWWPWWPWRDCDPDLIFKVTQDCHGAIKTIVNETIWDTRWNVAPVSTVTLVANQDACCVRPPCLEPNDKDCPQGDCLVITNVCGDLPDNIGGNPGAPAGPAGFLNPGVASASGDRPYAGAVSLHGVFGAGATADYYEFEWSDNGGGTWNAMPPAAAGGFSRSFWGPGLPAGPVGWHSVPFPFTGISSRNVIESREHFEATHDPASWNVTRFWEASNLNLLMNWLTDGNFADDTYQLRVRSWELVAGNLANDKILPLCDTKKDNGLVLTTDNRFVNPAGPIDSNGHPCGPGTVHTCTTEPDAAIVAVYISGAPVGACATVDAKKGGSLAIDLMAYDPDGHLALYSLQATYGINLAIDLLAIPGATLTPGPPAGAVPAAAQVGPDYGAAIGQGAVSPIWRGGIIRLTIPDLNVAFPETCCYQLELRVHKRTVVNCDHSLWGHANLSEYSFTVIV